MMGFPRQGVKANRVAAVMGCVIYSRDYGSVNLTGRQLRSSFWSETTNSAAKMSSALQILPARIFSKISVQAIFGINKGFVEAHRIRLADRAYVLSRRATDGPA
jgi:hypothetical protein